jgi:DNA-binding LacI/PurR family transcriptional regulator
MPQQVRSGGAPETRRPTLQDVAARAGVSRALVSIVVRNAPGASEATRARVLAVAAELGYRPDVNARLLARQRSRLLGVTVQLGHPFHADVAAGLYDCAEQNGYELALSATVPGRDERRAIDTLLGYRSEALILVAAGASEGTLAAAGRRVPVVVVARRVRSTAVDVVRTADDIGVGQAVEHLVALGHTAIAHVDGGRAAGAGDRRRGYRLAMRRRQLAEQVVTGGESEEDGARAGRLLLASGPPTAVICYNDRCAVGLMDVLIRAGVGVPDDVSVVGFDNSQLARLSHINLTTVAQDVAEMAALTIRRLVARLEGGGAGEGPGPAGGSPDLVRESVLPPRLVVRGSTAPPPARQTAWPTGE